MKHKTVKSLLLLLAMIAVTVAFSSTAFAASGNADVAGSVKAAFDTYMQPQIKTLVNFVVFPALDLGLGVFLAIRVAGAVTAYHSNHNTEIEWKAPAILLLGLVFFLSMPFWLWNIIGW